MERMTSRLAAAAVVAGVAVLGAGCAANAAAPAGGHPSPASGRLAGPAEPVHDHGPVQREVARAGPSRRPRGRPGRQPVRHRSQPAGDRDLARREGAAAMGEARNRARRVQVHRARPHNPGRCGREDRRRPATAWSTSRTAGTRRVQVFTPGRAVHPPVRQLREREGPVPLPGRPGGRRCGQRLRRGRPEPRPWPSSPPPARSSGRSAAARPATRTWPATSTWRASTRTAGSSSVNDDSNRILYIDPSGHKVDAFSPSTSGHRAGTCARRRSMPQATRTCRAAARAPGPTLVYDRAHRLIAKWPGTKYSLLRSPVFGPNGEVFALATDGSILKLRITLPGALT